MSKKKRREPKVCLTVNEIAEIMATSAGKSLGMEGNEFFAFVKKNQSKYLPAAKEVFAFVKERNAKG